MKSISTEDFFKLITIESGLDPVTASRIFYSMIKVISRELKGKQIIKLPDWGEFKLKIRKAQHRKSVLAGEGKRIIVDSPATAEVRFFPDYKVKEYFREFGEGTMIK